MDIYLPCSQFLSVCTVDFLRSLRKDCNATITCKLEDIPSLPCQRVFVISGPANISNNIISVCRANKPIGIRQQTHTRTGRGSTAWNELLKVSTLWTVDLGHEAFPFSFDLPCPHTRSLTWPSMGGKRVLRIPLNDISHIPNPNPNSNSKPLKL